VVNEIIFKNDENMKFYTGIPTVAAFNALYKIIEPKIIIWSKILEWSKTLCSSYSSE